MSGIAWSVIRRSTLCWQRILAFSQLFLRRPSFQVARNLRVADKVAFAVGDRIDDDTGPEAAAVLAHAPAFRFELSLALDGFKRALPQACRAVLFRVEAGKSSPMISDS